MQIVREQRLTYGAQGFQSASDHLYVNLAENFLPLLKQLKGAPLSFVLAIGLHEAEVILRGAEPLTLNAIADLTEYSRRAVWDAAAYLVKNHFVDEGRNARNERTFRPTDYIWFGGKRFAPKTPTPICEGAPAPESPICEHESDSPYAKTAYLEPLNTDAAISAPYAKNDTPATEKRRRYAKRAMQPMQPPVVDVGTTINSHQELNEQQQQTKAILRAAGIFYPQVLQKLALTVSIETAEKWAAWIKSRPAGVRNPQGIAKETLEADPTAEPPGQAKRETWGDALAKEEARLRQIEERETCGTALHKLWARSHGGCAECGIEPR